MRGSLVAWALVASLLAARGGQWLHGGWDVLRAASDRDTLHREPMLPPCTAGAPRAGM